MCFSIISCKKKSEPGLECGNANKVLFPKDAFERFYFRDSTYWIYKDSISGQIDSVWVQNSKSDFFGIETDDEDSKRKCFQYSHYSVNSLLDVSYDITLSSRGKYGEYYYSYINIFRKNPNIRIDFASLEDTVYRDEGLHYGVVSFQQSIYVSDFLFNDVLIWTYTEPIPIIFKKAYYVRNVGLVKYISTSGRVWELIRYKIK